MVIFWIILAIIVVAFLSAAFFVYDPYIIEAVVNKIDEWVEIIKAFEEEK